MQRFRHSKNGMVHDVEGIYTLYVDMMDMRAAILSRHMLIMETAKEHIKLLREQLKELQ